MVHRVLNYCVKPRGSIKGGSDPHTVALTLSQNNMVLGKTSSRLSWLRFFFFLSMYFSKTFPALILAPGQSGCSSGGAALMWSFERKHLSKSNLSTKFHLFALKMNVGREEKWKEEQRGWKRRKVNLYAAPYVSENEAFLFSGRPHSLPGWLSQHSRICSERLCCFVLGWINTSRRAVTHK